MWAGFPGWDELRGRGELGDKASARVVGGLGGGATWGRDVRGGAGGPGAGRGVAWASAFSGRGSADSAGAGQGRSWNQRQACF